MIVFKYLFIFCLFSVVGWVLELIYRSAVTKRFFNPGFMSGCVVPLYGFGAIIMNIICSLFENINGDYKLILIFLIAVVVLSLLEYISGLILLNCFHLKLWDYTEYKYNYKGFICLEFSTMWGLLALLYQLYIYNWVNKVSILFANNTTCIFFLGIFLGIFIIDLCVSIQLLSRLTKYAKDIKEIIDVEKLKIDVRRKARRKKIIDSIYPYLSTNKFLREKIKEFNNKK